jgi:opacity protein-like surface antigen
MKLISRLILSVICCLSVVTSINAGWFGGANVGAVSVNIDKQITYPVGSASAKQAQYNAAYTGFRGQVIAGYDFWSDRKIGLSIEGDLNYNTGQSTYTINNFFLSNTAQAKESLGYGYALFLLPTYHLSSDAALFLGPGISRTQFQAQSGGDTGGNIGMTGNVTNWLTGFGFKAGTSLKINTKMVLLLTYEYMHFNSMNLTTTEPLTNSLVQTQYTPDSQSIMLGFKYAFGDFVGR